MSPAPQVQLRAGIAGPVCGVADDKAWSGHPFLTFFFVKLQNLFAGPLKKGFWLPVFLWSDRGGYQRPTSFLENFLRGHSFLLLLWGVKGAVGTHRGCMRTTVNNPLDNYTIAPFAPKVNPPTKKNWG